MGTFFSSFHHPTPHLQLYPIINWNATVGNTGFQKTFLLGQKQGLKRDFFVFSCFFLTIYLVRAVTMLLFGITLPDCLPPVFS